MTVHSFSIARDVDPPTKLLGFPAKTGKFNGHDRLAEQVIVIFDKLDLLLNQARKLEAQLDDQMHLYRKLVSAEMDTSSDTDLESGVDQLLKQLPQVNLQMQAWVSAGGSEFFSHTLTRHQEILQDLSQEFNRLRSSHRAKKEHASLLEDFREFDRTRLDLEEGGGSQEQALLKERASIIRNTGQVKHILSAIKKKKYNNGFAGEAHWLTRVN